MAALSIVCCLPSNVFELASGCIYGEQNLALAVAITTVAKVSGSCISFAIGRYCGHSFVQKRLLGSKTALLRGFSRALEIRPITFMFLIQSAYLPIFVKNVRCGTTAAPRSPLHSCTPPTNPLLRCALNRLRVVCASGGTQYGLSVLDVKFVSFFVWTFSIGIPFSTVHAWMGLQVRATLLGVDENEEGEETVEEEDNRVPEVMLLVFGVVSIFLVLGIIGRITNKASALANQKCVHRCKATHIRGLNIVCAHYARWCYRL